MDRSANISTQHLFIPPEESDGCKASDEEAANSNLSQKKTLVQKQEISIKLNSEGCPTKIIPPAIEND